MLFVYCHETRKFGHCAATWRQVEEPEDANSAEKYSKTARSKLVRNRFFERKSWPRSLRDIRLIQSCNLSLDDDAEPPGIFHRRKTKCSF